MEAMPRSRPVTSTAAFLLTAAGQLYFLHGLLSEGLRTLTPVPAAELFFCALTVAAALFTASRRGWRSRAAGYAAFAVYAAYGAFNIYFYSFFSSLYQSALVTTYRSYGAAIEAAKLILLLVGIVAAIPVMPGPTGKEYARALEKAAKRQQAGWTEEGKKEVRSEVSRTFKQLRETMSQQDLEELARQLTQKLPAEGTNQSPDALDKELPADTPVGVQIEEKPEHPASSITDDWKGWGCG